jgi:uncharacterized membrane protein (UPF0127 family)
VKVLILFCWLLSVKACLCAQSLPTTNYVLANLNNQVLRLEIVDTAEERARGLMFRQRLPENQGMLFVFETETIHPFWMKNTYIPLDILWLDKSLTIVFIKQYARPMDERIIMPTKKAKFVMEIKAGLANKLSLQTGDKIQFQ